MNAEEAATFAELELERLNGFPCGVVRWSHWESRALYYFVWNSRQAIESGGREGRLTRVGPVAVEKASGRVFVLTSAGADPHTGQPPRLFPPDTDASTETGARLVAQAYLDATCERACLLEGCLAERPWCWVFGWNDERYLAGDLSCALVGGGPLLVKKATGDVLTLPGNGSWRAKLAKLEQDASS